MQYLGAISKMISVRFQYHNIQVCAPTTNAKEAEVEWFCGGLPTTPRTNTKKKYVLFIIGDWNAKVRNQEILGVTGKFCLEVQNEAGQRLTVFPKNTPVIANTLFQQHQRRLYTWTSPDGQYRNQIDYILCSHRWRGSIHSAKTRLKADCGSDQEHFVAKFRVKLK